MNLPGNLWFSAQRFFAVVRKEFVQMRRDKLTFGMMVGIPLLQLMLFGYAINADPKHLSTAILSADHSPFVRTLSSALQNSQYFRLASGINTRAQAEQALATGQVQFVLEVPPDFTRRLLRNEHPLLHIAADASDPAATGTAIAALQTLAQAVFTQELRGPLAELASPAPAFELRLHKRYNPEGLSQYNIVPGLLGVVLTMTMIMMTALAITKEFERGTMESLLAMPLKPIEVMLGKILPYIIIGYVQVTVILLAAYFIFEVPFVGSLLLLYACTLAFILANLTVGISISSSVRNQTQAMQMTFFFFLPSILMSGFMFPFAGMPRWAQLIGEALPLTHFLRIIRGILLKGNGWAQITSEMLALALFTGVMLLFGLKQYRRTLD